MGNMPIGQGLSVTPMQMATAYTAVANGGVLREPYLIQGDRKPGRRVLSAKTAHEVAKMLEGVLAAGGTAQEASVDGYTLAGKTGTAEKADKYGYSKTKFVASFIGFAPAKDPRLLVSVMVDEPQGRLLRRHRGRAGLRAHHGVRAAVPEDPAALSGGRGLRRAVVVGRESSSRVRLDRLGLHERAQRAAHAAVGEGELVEGALGGEDGLLDLGQALFQRPPAALLARDPRAQIALDAAVVVALAVGLVAQLGVGEAGVLGSPVGVLQLA